jgi:hypothetical protein
LRRAPQRAACINGAGTHVRVVVRQVLVHKAAEVQHLPMRNTTAYEAARSSGAAPRNYRAACATALPAATAAAATSAHLAPGVLRDAEAVRAGDEGAPFVQQSEAARQDEGPDNERGFDGQVALRRLARREESETVEGGEHGGVTQLSCVGGCVQRGSERQRRQPHDNDRVLKHEVARGRRRDSGGTVHRACVTRKVRARSCGAHRAARAPPRAGEAAPRDPAAPLLLLLLRARQHAAAAARCTGRCTHLAEATPTAAAAAAAADVGQGGASAATKRASTCRAALLAPLYAAKSSTTCCALMA